MILSLLLAAAPVTIVSPIPADVRASFSLSPHYTKVVVQNGFPLLGSKAVANAALREARQIVVAMTVNHPEYLTTLAAAKIRLAVMAPTELTTAIPEHADLTPKAYWDRRARGLGATTTRPAVSCAEENLLEEPGDPYAAENICVHEFAHTLHEHAIVKLIPDFQARLERAFVDAKKRGTWRNTYAMTNEREYWAEAVQSWFDTNRHDDSEHGAIDTREEVVAADPAIAALIVEALGEVSWRYRRPSKRTGAERAELGPWPEPLPSFAWPAELAALPRDRSIELSTGALDVSASPHASEASTVVFENQSALPIDAKWLTFDGAVRLYETIQPGASSDQQTYVGHVWIVEQRGVRLGWVAAPAGRSRLVVGAPEASLGVETGQLQRTVSPPSKTATTIVVENRTPSAIEWSWLTFSGTLQRYATIKAGGTLTQPTYEGHVWVVSRKGQRVGWFEARSTKSTLLVK